MRTWSNSIRPNCRKHQCLTPNFYWIRVRCVTARSGVLRSRPPSGNPLLCFESDTAQYSRQLASRGRGVSMIITWSLVTAVTGLCYENNNRKCSRPKDQQKSLCLSLFLDLCFILKSYRMSYCWCFSAWLPVCLVLNSTELLPSFRNLDQLESSFLTHHTFWSTCKCCCVNTNQTRANMQHCNKLVPDLDQSKRAVGVKTP